jgi:hypothetical protein
MKFRWTIKQLKPVLNDDEVATYKLIRATVVERRIDLNAYCPLAKALARCELTLDAKLRELGHDSPSNETLF